MSLPRTPKALLSKIAPPAPALSNPIIQAQRDRRYRLKHLPSLRPRGQRSVIFEVMENDPTRIWSIAEMAEEAGKAGLTSLTPLYSSCMYHLHNMMLQGFVELVDPYPDHVTISNALIEEEL